MDTIATDVVTPTVHRFNLNALFGGTSAVPLTLVFPIFVRNQRQNRKELVSFAFQ